MIYNVNNQVGILLYNVIQITYDSSNYLVFSYFETSALQKNNLTFNKLK